MKMDDPPEKVLQVRNHRYLNHPDHGLLGERFLIRPGPAGKHLLIDPEDGKPLEEVTIEVGSQAHVTWEGVAIKTERYRDNPGGHFNYREAHYDIRGDTLKVSHKYLSYGIMTDKMATNLINTIDALIPGSTNPIPQPGRRPTPELQPPRQLPAPRRRTPRG